MITATRTRSARCLLLLLVALPGLSALPLSQDAAARRLLGRGSLAEFPQWLTLGQGLARLTFRTSESNGFLFYMDGSGLTEHYMFIRLQGGRVAVDIGLDNSETLQGEFGSELGDNATHTITILHEFMLFDFELDGSIALSISANSAHLDTRSHVFFGGLPEGYSPHLPAAASEASFAGCLEAAQFANGSLQFVDIFTLSPIRENGVVLGCSDPCAGVNCGTGVCVPRWIGGDDMRGVSFCDCNGTGLAGSNCASDITTSELVHRDGNYSCFSLPSDRFHTDYESVGGIIQLVPPLPEDGAIMTAVSGDGMMSYSLLLQDERLVLRFTEGNTTNMELSSGMRLSSRTGYQLQFSRGSTGVNMRVAELDDPSKFDAPSASLPTPAPDFDAGYVCLGGSQLEVPIYRGAIREAYFKQYLLSESSHFSLLSHELASKSDVISYLPGFRQPSLSFSRHGLSSQHIELEVRTNSTDWMLFSSETSSHSLSIVIFSDMIFIVVAAGTSTSQNQQCEPTTISDGKWHSIAVDKISDSSSAGAGLRVVVDNSITCSLEHTAMVDEVITALSDEPLYLGHTSEGSSGNGVPFEGCLQNIKFVDGLDTFQPNLDAAIRREERFTGSGCYYCDDADTEMIQCDGVCRNVGTREPLCCPENFGEGRCDTSTETAPTSTPTPHPSSSSSSPLPGDIDRGLSGEEIGIWVGVAIAAICFVILVIIAILFVITCYHFHAQRQGFYHTHENQDNGQLPHVSATLRRVDSQTIISDNSDYHYVQRGPGDNEFYM